MTTLVLISLVRDHLDVDALFAERAEHLAATPTWLRMPMPTIETLQIFGSPTTSLAPVAGTTLPFSSSIVRGDSRCGAP